MTASRCTVAALQMVSGKQLADNLQRAEQLLNRVADAGADLAVLPETFALFDSRQQVPLGQREALSCELRDWLAEQAKRTGLYLVGGTLPLAPTAESDRVWAASVVVSPQQGVIGQYHKMHLFDADVGDAQGCYRESDQFLPGDAPLVVDTPWGGLGVAICYDIRFPLLFAAMVEAGADLIAVPAAFTRQTGQAHWLPLLRARAIESQCAVIGANQGGIHTPSRHTSGGSVVIDSWGRVLAEAGFGEQVVIAEIDLEQQRQQRAAMPLQSHQRFRVQLKA